MSDKAKQSIEFVRNGLGEENFNKLLSITGVRDIELAAAFLATTKEERDSVKTGDDLMRLLGRKHAENRVAMALVRAGVPVEDAVSFVRETAASL
ncbi:hypothetical protein RsoPWF2_08 [Ralstonia phage vRsoP-WF2]|nr:hypothetical protein RsoPWF2_08 [Ralstonia phage vRsoP-WF2]UHX60299.1 hypothetical protein RsoPWM2_08 [Ralstonia phage vRsoP-WM2]UHX60351.1 hypothetical protein RsoPWR2_08 [Ralstonia phage vRsoP-WR2]